VTGFVVLKAGALAAVARAMRVPAGQRALFAALLAQGGEFAFVVFGVARAARLLPGDWDRLLTLVVAVSMLLTPVLVVAAEVVQRRRGRARPEPDAVEDDGAPVIIAGFGRFGQIVGRLLFASGLRATVLDYDPDQVEFLRRFGFRVFYGDATRLDLLEAAGAHHAHVLVNAIDDVEGSLRLVDVVREHFPALHVVARARNVTHWNALRERGVTVIERETFESALRAGRHALEALGVRAHEARERADRFRRHTQDVIEGLLAEAADESRRATVAREAREQLVAQFEQDRAEIVRLEGGDWRRGARRPTGGVAAR
jgi:glutathione-regulated potassium-efflux system ancillary protein KefC